MCSIWHSSPYGISSTSCGKFPLKLWSVSPSVLEFLFVFQSVCLFSNLIITEKKLITILSDSDGLQSLKCSASYLHPWQHSCLGRMWTFGKLEVRKPLHCLEFWVQLWRENLQPQSSDVVLRGAGPDEYPLPDPDFFSTRTRLGFFFFRISGFKVAALYAIIQDF